MALRLRHICYLNGLGLSRTLFAARSSLCHQLPGQNVHNACFAKLQVPSLLPCGRAAGVSGGLLQAYRENKSTIEVGGPLLLTRWIRTTGVTTLRIGDGRLEDAAGKGAETKEEKLSLVQRFKKMYKDYWYVLIPVHIVTSVGWFGSFYLSVKSGLDVVGLLEQMGASEKIINPLRGSSAGYVALAYAMYKIATPARYAVTLGGTTASINYLTKWGYIKPMPSAEQMKKMYNARKDSLNEQREALRRKLRQHRAAVKLKMSSKKRARK